MKRKEIGMRERREENNGAKSRRRGKKEKKKERMRCWRHKKYLTST
jgi:hypothetical protein